MKKTKLTLRRERIQELTELRGVLGGTDSMSHVGCGTQPSAVRCGPPPESAQSCGPDCASTAGRLSRNFPC